MSDMAIGDKKKIAVVIGVCVLIWYILKMQPKTEDREPSLSPDVLSPDVASSPPETEPVATAWQVAWGPPPMPHWGLRVPLKIDLTQLLAHLRSLGSGAPRVSVNMAFKGTLANGTIMQAEVHNNLWQDNQVQQVKGRHNYSYADSTGVVWFDRFALDLTPIRNAARANSLSGVIKTTVNGSIIPFPF